jgi:hypothetical protein
MNCCWIFLCNNVNVCSSRPSIWWWKQGEKKVEKKKISFPSVSHHRCLNWTQWQCHPIIIAKIFNDTHHAPIIQRWSWGIHSNAPYGRPEKWFNCTSPTIIKMKNKNNKKKNVAHISRPLWSLLFCFMFCFSFVLLHWCELWIEKRERKKEIHIERKEIIQFQIDSSSESLVIGFRENIFAIFSSALAF